ncbi:MAG: P-loop NTPase [Nitrospirota bacterium]|nr:P-loop NTPase [Nitrospirota bacterium]
MATIITVASGNVGVGKSVVVSNLGVLLAREGRRVVLVDLDIGKPTLHTLFGMFKPMFTLSDFLSRRIGELKDIAHTVGWGTGLRLIPGTGESLPSAYLSLATQQRLIRQLHHLDADIVVLDCATGTSLRDLDFFLLGDHKIVVANSDPTSVIELYRFVKLAAIRSVLKSILGDDCKDLNSSLLEREFESVQQVLDVSKELDPLNQFSADEVLRDFQPLFVLNRTTAQTKMSIPNLQQVIAKFIGSELVSLGEIPQNEAVEQSIRVFQPVVDLAPKSSAAKAFSQVVSTLLGRLKTRQSVLMRLTQEPKVLSQGGIYARSNYAGDRHESPESFDY